MSDAATTHPIGMQRRISMRQGIPLSKATIRRRVGGGAISMKSCLISATKPPRITALFRVTTEPNVPLHQATPNFLGWLGARRTNNKFLEGGTWLGLLRVPRFLLISF